MACCFHRVGPLLFAITLVCVAEQNASQDHTNQSKPAAVNSSKTHGQYIIEDQPERCVPPKECASPPPAEPSSKAKAGTSVEPSENGEKQETFASEPIPVPKNERVPSPKKIEASKSNVPWEKRAAINTQPPPRPPYLDHELKDGETGPPVGPGSDAFSGFLVVFGGGLIGFIGSVPILRNRFASPLLTRPNGDVSHSSFDEKSRSQPWQKAVKDTKIFQLQNALRQNLISREEFRELRNKYLISGNFAFSMLVPISFGLVLLTTNSGHWYESVGVSIFSALITVLLVTYAVDRRHQFRSEYRSVIIQNLTDSSQHDGRDREAAAEGRTSWVVEQLVQIATILAILVANLRTGSTSGTAGESGEKGSE